MSLENIEDDDSSKEQITEFNHTLKDPFEYGKGGGMKDATFITFRAPKANAVDQCALIEAAFAMAVSSLTELAANSNINQEKKKEASELEGGEIIMMLGSCPDVDMAEIYRTAKSIFINGKTATIDDIVQLTGPTYDKISMTDMRMMTGDYIANFLVASYLD